MDKLDTMRTFVRVVETGSFSKAAKAEGVVQSTVSKQIAALEARLGAELLRRTARSVNLTEAGQDYYESASKLLIELDDAESRLSDGARKPTGRVRVTMSAGFGRMFVVPRLPQFLDQYPGLKVDLDISERHISLAEDGIDAAVRIGHLKNSPLLARRVGSIELATMASQAYLDRRGEPKTPAELESHDCVVFMYNGQPRIWEFGGKDRTPALIPDGVVRTNDAEHGRAAVLAGLGIIHTQSWLFADEIETGGVKRILTNWAPEHVPVHVVAPAGRRMSSKVRVFADFVRDILSEEPLLRIR